MEDNFGWWKFSAFNRTPEYGFGSAVDAEKRAAELNASNREPDRDVNMVQFEFLGATDDEANAAIGGGHLGNGEGYDL